jgi:hypothetical protein
VSERDKSKNFLIDRLCVVVKADGAMIAAGVNDGNIYTILNVIRFGEDWLTSLRERPAGEYWFLNRFHILPDEIPF